MFYENELEMTNFRNMFPCLDVQDVAFIDGCVTSHHVIDLPLLYKLLWDEILDNGSLGKLS